MAAAFERGKRDLPKTELDPPTKSDFLSNDEVESLLKGVCGEDFEVIKTPFHERVMRELKERKYVLEMEIEGLKGRIAEIDFLRSQFEHFMDDGK